MRQDLRLALRLLRKHAAFTLLSVATLATGIGILAAMFAIVDAVLVEPIVPNQDRMARIWLNEPEIGSRVSTREPISYPEYEAWRRETRTFASLSAINYADSMSTALTFDGRTSPVQITPVSANFFETLGVTTPVEGRLFSPEDDRRGADLAAVVSESLWRRERSSLVGKTLGRSGGGRRLRVVGVAPAGFDLPTGTDFWVPITPFLAGGGMGAAAFNEDSSQTENREFRQFEFIGRLAQGVTLSAARSELDILHRQFRAGISEDATRSTVVAVPLVDSVIGQSSRTLLGLLFASAALVFVIAGVNVATLILMQASARRTEWQVRRALGAARSHLARQALVETGIIGVLGIAMAIPVTLLVLEVSIRVAPSDIPRISTATMDWRVFGFLVAAAASWVLALGSLPVAVRDRRLMSPSRVSSRDLVQVRALRGFAVAEIAIAVIVAVGAVLLVRSFGNLQRIDRGFRAADVSLVRLLLPEARYPSPRHRLDFFNTLLSRVRAIPGVIDASTMHIAPGSGSVGLSARMLFEGQTTRTAASNPLATWEPVLGSHFETLGIPLVRGRLFSEADTRTSMPVAIVTAAVARRYWPGEDALGKRLKLADDAEFGWVTVVGVVGDTRYRELTRPWMTVYFPADQFFFFQPQLIVRTSPTARAAMTHVGEAIQFLEPDVAVVRVERMAALLDVEVSRPRAALAVSTLLAVVAALLSVAGVYGVLSYEVRSRRVELAVRSALGSSPGRLARLVLEQGLRVGGIGAALGLVGAALAAPLIGPVLFEVSPLDAGAFATGVAILVAIVATISCVPARRAAGVDPLAALRHE